MIKHVSLTSRKSLHRCTSMRDRALFVISCCPGLKSIDLEWSVSRDYTWAPIDLSCLIAFAVTSLRSTAVQLEAVLGLPLDARCGAVNWVMPAEPETELHKDTLLRWFPEETWTLVRKLNMELRLTTKQLCSIKDAKIRCPKEKCYYVFEQLVIDTYCGNRREILTLRRHKDQESCSQERLA